jgi:hypothetical protein
MMPSDVHLIELLLFLILALLYAIYIELGD